MGRVRQLTLAITTVLVVLLLLAAAWANRKPSPVKSPIVVNTWAFTKATEKAWTVLSTSQSTTAALDSVEVVGSQSVSSSSIIVCYYTYKLSLHAIDQAPQDFVPFCPILSHFVPFCPILTSA